jgi:hypothetical protein
MTAGAAHQTIGVRAHRRRFRIDGDGDHVRLKRALKTLEECEEAVLLALEYIGTEQPQRTALTMRTALRLLTEGTDGSLR